MTEELTPLQLVLSKYGFPFEPMGFQAEAINELGPLPRTGIYMEVGTGKTFVSTAMALYKKLEGTTDQWIVIMPPVLLRQWFNWLTNHNGKGVTGVTAVMYRGTPKKRKELPLDANFICMSMQVFKNDWDYLYKMFEHRKVGGLVDEATSIKSVASQNYKLTRDFFVDRELMLLTGTPLSKPDDAFAYIKLIAPTIYRNLRHFESLHVAERDHFEKVVRWDNIELLYENMHINAVRTFKRDALPYLDKPFYDPIEYDLEPAHAKLYKRLAEEQILLLESGGKIDASTPSRLYNMLQQIICNPGHFSEDAMMRSAAHELLDTVIAEVAAEGRKLIVSSKYVMTNRGLLQYLQPYGAVAFYGEMSAKRQEEGKESFISDPKCQVAIIQPQSGGYGLDGFQAVCSDVLFLELPTIPKDFTQVVGRVDRGGQTTRPHIRIALAAGTCQKRLYNNLLNTDELVNRVQGGWEDLRKSIYGAD